MLLCMHSHIPIPAVPAPHWGSCYYVALTVWLNHDLNMLNYQSVMYKLVTYSLLTFCFVSYVFVLKVAVVSILSSSVVSILSSSSF